jgi:4-amino-4-deoxy-L-arabinose transferase-like glycosyltransferase
VEGSGGLKAAVLLLLSVILLLDVASVRHDSLTDDEPEHYRYGVKILAGDAARYNNSKMPITALNALPAWLSVTFPPGPRRAFLGRIETGRYVTIAFSLLVAICVFAWSRDLYGPAAGLLSLTLYAFDPNVIAHSRLITTDLYASGTILIALYCFWRFVTLGGWPRALLSAGALGLAQAAKYTAVYLYPILILILLYREGPRLAALARSGQGRELARACGTFAKYALVFAAVSLLVINLAFLCDRSFMRVADYRFQSGMFQRLQATPVGHLPVPVPHPYLYGLDWVWFDDRQGVGHTYLLGHLRTSEGFKGYFLVASLFKVPLAMLGAIAASLVVCFAGRRRRRFRDHEVFLLLPVVFFTVYFNFVSNAHWGLRMFLMVFPLLHVFCGVLLRDGWPRGPRARAVLGLAGAWLMISVLSYHPHYIPYFNELVWDRKDAYKILSDSNIDWGQGQQELARWRVLHPDAHIEPRVPRSGLVVVGVTTLTGVVNSKRYQWLRDNFEPIGHIAYCYLIFDVPDARLRAIERAE